MWGLPILFVFPPLPNPTPVSCWGGKLYRGDLLLLSSRAEEEEQEEEEQEEERQGWWRVLLGSSFFVSPTLSLSLPASTL